MLEPIKDKEQIISKLISDVRWYMGRYGVSLDDAIADYDMPVDPSLWDSVRWYFDPENTEGFNS